MSQTSILLNPIVAQVWELDTLHEMYILFMYTINFAYFEKTLNG